LRVKSALISQLRWHLTARFVEGLEGNPMARVWRRFAEFAVLPLLIVVLAHCGLRPKAGGKCSSNGKYMCTDPSGGLLCDNGTLVPLPCRGPKGCAGTGSASQCDDDLAKEGDACVMMLNENFACSTDHKKELICKEGKFAVRRACKGTKECTIETDALHCDDSMGDVGDVCVEEAGDANYACSVDKQTEVVCKGDKFLASNSCRGAKGCWITNDVVHCDMSFAREGDVCRPVDNHSCSEDAKSEMKCSPQMKWVKKRDCKHEGCKVKGNEVYCD
jgi:hypothetical protein